MPSKRPRLEIADVVTRKHGEQFAEAWLDRVMRTMGIELSETFWQTKLVTWPEDDEEAQELFHDIESAICERTFEAARKVIAEAFVRAATDVLDRQRAWQQRR